MPILSNVAAVALLASLPYGQKAAYVTPLLIRPTDPAAIEKLRTMLNDEDLWVRARAAESILSLGLSDPKAQSIVREEARGDGEPVRAEDVPSLLTAVKSENSNTRAGAMQALQGMHGFPGAEERPIRARAHARGSSCKHRAGYGSYRSP